MDWTYENMLWSTQTNNYSNLRTTIKQYELDYSLYFNVSIISLMTASHRGSIYTLYPLFSLSTPFIFVWSSMNVSAGPSSHMMWKYCDRFQTIAFTLRAQFPYQNEPFSYNLHVLWPQICTKYSEFKVRSGITTNTTLLQLSLLLPSPPTCSTVWCG